MLNAVGYPNPDRSHVRSMDIWQSGSGSDQVVSTGWLGRYLDSSCADCQRPYNALEIDDTLSLALKGRQRKGLALKTPDKFHQLTQNRLLSKVSQEAGAGHQEPAAPRQRATRSTAAPLLAMINRTVCGRCGISITSMAFSR